VQKLKFHVGSQGQGNLKKIPGPENEKIQVGKERKEIK